MLALMDDRENDHFAHPLFWPEPPARGASPWMLNARREALLDALPGTTALVVGPGRPVVDAMRAAGSARRQ